MAFFSKSLIKEFEWRDDTKKNYDLYKDSRGVGLKYTEYTIP